MGFVIAYLSSRMRLRRPPRVDYILGSEVVV